VPADAATLVAAGHRVTIEQSATRAIDTAGYRAAGCEVAPTGSWPAAPSSAVVVGIKELPDAPAPLRHTHVFFAHAFKGQAGAQEVLGRFVRGGGALLDVEYLRGANGHRSVAFGYWAGYVGAALAVLHARHDLRIPLMPTTKKALDEILLASAEARAPRAPAVQTALVIGSRGRSGRGARDALTAAGISVTGWDRAETRALDRDALLQHDVLANCVVTDSPQEPFLTSADLDRPRRALRVVADVTCDVTSTHNLIPVNTATTTWEAPVRTVGSPGRAVDVIAIDNLPSLLPVEASTGFSAELTPLIDDLPRRSGPWRHAEAAYAEALRGR
jgi:saccharopine dehydrogenase (NAD+, L-lysine-forming)